MSDTMTIWSDDPPLRVEVELGEGAWTPSAPPGWEEVGRPRDISLTEWSGRSPLRVAGPFMIDGWQERRSVEADCRNLERMYGMMAGSPEPPLVLFDAGGSVPHDHTNSPFLEYVIENVEWGDYLGEVDRRLRQEGIITFLQYVEDERLAKQSAAQRNRRRNRKHKKGKGKKGARQKTYTVRAGDTLTSIAARQLGNANRWREIAKLNNIRDPRSIRPGQVLKLP